jgi:DNA-binding SARP family transcriptional activator
MAGLITRQWEKEAWLTDLVKSQIHNKPDRSRLFDPLKLPVLTAKFFGSPRLFLNGRLVDDRLWPTSKSKKALFYLILRYPEKTGAEQLIEALWPGSGRTEGQNSLRKAMQHIRQVLSGAGADREIVLSDKGYFSIAPGVVIFRDIDWLAKSAAQTGIAGKHGQSQRRELERTLARIEPGIALGWFDNWAEDLRGVVMKRYETALKLIADHYWSRNKYPEASGYYKKLTAVNPGDESYHRSLMRIASRRRNFREVKRIYDRLVLFLKAEMDSSPQPATKRLYRSLSVPKS